jgi:hypothetical protein
MTFLRARRECCGWLGDLPEGRHDDDRLHPDQSVLAAAQSIGNPSIVENPDGSAELYITGLNGKIYTHQLTDTAPTQWWTVIPAATRYGPSAALGPALSGYP